MGTQAPLNLWHTKSMWLELLLNGQLKDDRGQVCYCHLTPCKTWGFTSANTAEGTAQSRRETDSWWHNLSSESTHTYSPISEYSEKPLPRYETIWTKYLRRVRGKQCIIREKKNLWLTGKNQEYFSGLQGLLWCSAHLLFHLFLPYVSLSSPYTLPVMHAQLHSLNIPWSFITLCLCQCYSPCEVYPSCLFVLKSS